MTDFLKKHKLKVLIFFLIIISYCLIPFLGTDHPIEEAIESVIKHFTGVKIDLTPEIGES